MASVNADLVRQTLSLFEVEDWDRAVPAWSDDAWMTGPPDCPESATFRGREEVLGQFQRLAADWEEHRFDDLEIALDDGTWVVVTFTWRVRGATSGLPVEAPMSGAYRVDEGLITEAHFRRTVEETLAIATGSQRTDRGR